MSKVLVFASDVFNKLTFSDGFTLGLSAFKQIIDGFSKRWPVFLFVLTCAIGFTLVPMVGWLMWFFAIAHVHGGVMHFERALLSKQSLGIKVLFSFILKFRVVGGILSLMFWGVFIVGAYFPVLFVGYGDGPMTGILYFISLLLTPVMLVGWSMIVWAVMLQNQTLIDSIKDVPKLLASGWMGYMGLSALLLCLQVVLVLGLWLLSYVLELFLFSAASMSHESAAWLPFLVIGAGLFLVNVVLLPSLVSLSVHLLARKQRMHLVEMP